MYVCLCLCLYGREVTVGYARLRGSMGATFCPSAALRSAIEFLFWDHWETAVLGQILAGRSREVTGGHGRSRKQISAIWRPLDCRLNFSSGIITKQPFWAKSWPGGHGRSREVTGGYRRLRKEKRRKVEERQQKGRRRPKKMTEMSSVKCRVWSVEWKV